MRDRPHCRCGHVADAHACNDPGGIAYRDCIGRGMTYLDILICACAHYTPNQGEPKKSPWREDFIRGL